MSWWEHMACKDIAAGHFDDRGDSIAWDACDRCEVLPECFADARENNCHGVYRGGMAWPDWNGRDKAAKAQASSARARKWHRIRVLRERGMGLSAIGREVGMDHSSVLNALRRMGVA